MTAPIRLWTLWDVMQLVRVDELLSVIRSVGHHAFFANALKPGEQRDASCQLVEREFKRLRVLCADLSLHVAVAQIDSILSLIELRREDLGRVGESVERASNMIASTIETELSLRVFVSLPPDRVPFFEARARFGNDVERAFPSASPEIAEAAKCFALGRFSASVFHLMRALEVGLKCLADQFQVPFAHQNWQTVIDQVEAKIRAMNSTTHGPQWKEDQQFFSEAAAQFLVLKNGWRNYAMHLHERYDEERARDIWNSVSAFLRQLSKRLTEPSAS